jgi:hypothetical protein
MTFGQFYCIARNFPPGLFNFEIFIFYFKNYKV